MSGISYGEVCGPHRFGWTKRHVDGRIVVDVTGELDLSTVPEWRECLRRVAESGAAATIVLDLSGVRFIDAQSTGLIIRAWVAARSRGRDLRVDGLHGMPARVFGLLGVEETVACSALDADSGGNADDRNGRAGGVAGPQCSAARAGQTRRSVGSRRG
ncbi:anti-sigma factor antagonist [Krasilnikovia sp. MM14-A1259]|uniref:anti-sigma factor antagonist n=1 Tax=Krasilnikovia sp. MM14-A1259 TaxID=3373539 RepID=UPI0038022C1D